MILDCVLTATNTNELYLDFTPIFIKTWKKMYPTIDIKVILIAKEIPKNLEIFKENIILFEPIETITTSFTSQFIRLLYPSILPYKNGILITDIDMLPMNKTYYTENIKSYNDNTFIYYRENICFEHKQIAMCYNVATPSTWKDVFNIHSITDIKTVLKNTYNDSMKKFKKKKKENLWTLDQLTLYEKIMEWNKKTNNFVCLKEKDTGFRRLCRSTIDIHNISLKEKISSGYYTDYHCLRPMSKYSKINHDIYNFL